MNSKGIIKFKNISKNYFGIQALKNVTFSIEECKINSIVGENGAGKSTLLKILAGEIVSYDGDVVIDDKIVKFKSEREAIRQGISIVSQELNLCPNLNVVQNIFLGQEINNHGYLNKKEILTNAKKIMEVLDLKVNLEIPVSYLGRAQKQLIEIAKAVSYDARIIIMDEPTASLNQIEVERLFNLLRELTEKGKTIIFVSHRIEEILEISSRINILRDGKFISSTINAKETNINTNKIVKLMIGREIVNKIDHRDIKTEEVVLRVGNFSKERFFKDVSFNLKKGEILGFAGLEGSGRYELSRAIYGLFPRDDGELYLENKRVNIKSPTIAINNGIGFLSRYRKDEGIFDKMDLIRNICMVVSLEDKMIKEKKYEKMTENYIKKLDIKCRNIKQIIATLSGGNQQKCILSRWLAKGLKILIMEEPTRGIDIGAKAEILKLVKNIAKEGASIIIISSELPELINVCDRIIVMERGKIAGEVKASKTNQEELMIMATRVKTKIV